MFMILFSCQNKNHNKNVQFEYVKDMIFDSGFKSGNAQIEFINGREFLCIAEYQKEKKIVLHALDGKESISIGLSRLDLFNERALAFEVFNLDTILVLPYYSNILYCMNQKGDVWKTIDLNPYLEKEGRFELKRSATPFHYNNNALVFSLEYLIDTDVVYDAYSYRKKRNAAPILLKIEDIFKDTLDVQFGLRNLYNHFSDAKHANVEGNNFAFINDQIVFNSAYSDSLYIIDPNHLEIKQKIKISSDYSRIYIDPITNEQQMQNPNLVNQNFTTNGQIRSVKYDSDERVYLVFVSHKPKEVRTSWSVIILDSNFNKIDEYLMDDSKYAHYGLISSKGLLVSNYYETLRDIVAYDKNTYALYDLE